MRRKIQISSLVMIALFSLWLIERPANSIIKKDKEMQWLVKNSHEILSLESEVYKDLEFLKPLLKDKKYVFLGESSHGISEYNQIKVRMVKYLHKELRFDVIAFESPVLDASLSYSEKEMMGYSGKDLNQEAVYNFWHAGEVTPLFDYIIDNKSKNPLILTGFDIQLKSDVLERFLTKISKTDTELAEEFAELEMNYKAIRMEMMKGTAPSDEDIKYFELGYQKAMGYIHKNEDKIFEEYKEYPELKKLLILGMQNRIDLIKSRATTRQHDFIIRDELMAKNIEELAKEVYPGKKIIFWAHNGHIRDNNSEVLQNVEGGTKFYPWTIPTMYENLPNQMKEESYNIGLYAYEGSFIDTSGQIATYNNGEKYKEISLEYKLNQAGSDYSFIDISRQKENQYNKWIFEPIESVYQGLFLEKFIPKKTYNGLTFIKEVNPPLIYND
ncbi:hypothetical protein DRW41_08890 [Neobacillus piezotolerans]|uniref:Erythromycin esterase n=1 Tax=Neobacillus piezotolerans TaxID=2259171 RepID=A0A3D8GV55_9BACI|nr:erythromycin esterase family protein [Neobacillus piezotolerans]RDU37916.1 hypothetical protein DRW41_08890 [Neobacillus piezotolerans]